MQLNLSWNRIIFTSSNEENAVSCIQMIQAWKNHTPHNPHILEKIQFSFHFPISHVTLQTTRIYKMKTHNKNKQTKQLDLEMNSGIYKSFQSNCLINKWKTPILCAYSFVSIDIFLYFNIQYTNLNVYEKYQKQQQINYQK